MDVPDGWPQPPQALWERSKAAVLAALNDTAATRRRLDEFYDGKGDYAGSTFVTAPPIISNEITAADLYAVALLEVQIGPAAARRILQADIVEVLSTVRDDVSLDDADGEIIGACDAFYRAVKHALKDPDARVSDPWVTTSKLCARKRPRLMPVRDYGVRKLLGLDSLKSHATDLQIFRSLLRDPEVRRPLAEVQRDIPDPPLRVLDAALWMKVDEDKRARQRST